MDVLDTVDLTTVHGLGRARAEGAEEKQALEAFDAYFLGELMKRSAPQSSSGLFDGGQAGRMYRDHLYQELARIVAESGRFGIAGALEGRLSSEAESEAEAEAAAEEAVRPDGADARKEGVER